MNIIQLAIQCNKDRVQFVQHLPSSLSFFLISFLTVFRHWIWHSVSSRLPNGLVEFSPLPLSPTLSTFIPTRVMPPHLQLSVICVCGSSLVVYIKAAITDISNITHQGTGRMCRLRTWFSAAWMGAKGSNKWGKTTLRIMGLLPETMDPTWPWLIWFSSTKTSTWQ